ncbi:hypothetical protein, partial [Bacteroides gallinarum]|uniref:hypothetical protein n=1 Tax=Bacteroides gallinarum TaxID=376806 RepID=UPI00055981D4
QNSKGYKLLIISDLQIIENLLYLADTSIEDALSNIGEVSKLPICYRTVKQDADFKKVTY